MKNSTAMFVGALFLFASGLAALDLYGGAGGLYALVAGGIGFFLNSLSEEEALRERGKETKDAQSR